MQDNLTDQIDYDKLLRSHRKKILFNPSDLSTKKQIDKTGIYALVPHRDPFLYIDNIIAYDQEKLSAVGEKVVSANDPVLGGHFPSDPVFPGVLIIEAMGQLGTALMNLFDRRSEDVPAYTFIRATRILGAYFLSPVKPGSTMTLLGTRTEWDGITARFIGQALVNQQIVCVAAGELCVAS